ncbi:Cytochrome P450 monooxygenase cypX [Fusarium oxysporum f. sp. raphani]|uniref:Cytochrome P450 monooxygenase cypX n=1 Tax=Fusarium oxysporum f. sp. raphani TaxID=96318 RepID=A0A8J5PNF9_FUSOX|nr:Cytochrome P450 monooxygenase cypX [Fusarium oxysporum f. sp. raphani]
MNLSFVKSLSSNLSKIHLLLIALAITILTYLLLSTLLSILRSVRSPLQRIPGPWYAPLTTVHLRYLFSTGEIWKLVQHSHAKYSPICRLGPRHIWVSDKESLKQILSTIDLPKVAIYAEISRDRTSPGLFGEIMGKSSFSKGFGQVKRNEASGNSQMDETWKSIPRAIFDGLADRYKRSKAIDSIVRQRSDEKQHSPDLLQHLIENGKRLDNEETMNSRDILDQMSEILLAGSETTYLDGTHADFVSQYNRVLSFLCRKTLLYRHQSQPLHSFSWAEMRMIAANLLARYDITEVPGHVVDFRQFITMQFHTGHWNVILKKRK